MVHYYYNIRSKIRTSLLSGTTLVVDRYAYSGVAFTAAKQVIICKLLEIFL